MRKQETNIKVLQELLRSTGTVMDLRPVIALTMRECGATYQEIANVMDFSKQRAEILVKSAKAKL